MKTHAVSEGLKHIRRLEADSADAYEADGSSRESAQTRIKVEMETLQSAMKAALASESKSEADALQQQLTKMIDQRDESAAPARRYLTQDATVEKLGVMLSENPRGLLICRDELAGWLRTMEKAGREADREFYLEAWNGTGGFNVDRIGRGSTRIPALTLSLCGGIQPGKLERYISEAIGEGEGADGLLQRVQLLVWPDDSSFPEWEASQEWPDKAANTRAWEVYRRLSVIELPESGDGESQGIPALHFDSEAQELHTAWRSELETRLRIETVHTPAFEAHLSKYRSLAPALALIYYLAELPAGSPFGEITIGALKKALALSEFLETHARKVFAAELNPGLESAFQLSQKIKSGAVVDGCTVRDIYRHEWTGLRNARETYAAVEILEQYGWLRIETQDTGRGAKGTLSIHPELRANQSG
jgi:putative DNA primase/helicase